MRRQIRKPQSLRKIALPLVGTVLTVAGGVATNRVQGKWWLELLYFLAAIVFLGLAAATVTTSAPGKINKRKLQKVRSRLLSTTLPSYYKQLISEIQLKGQPSANMVIPATYESLRSTRHMRLKPKEMQSEPCNIEQAYERSGSSLLVLGQAGSGKTHSIAHLVSELAGLAKADLDKPLPFYLDLSGWDASASLERWCISSINKEYGPKETYVAAWFDEDDLMLALDGLDQLPRKRRTECLSAINRLRQEHSLLAIVVTSREQEYQDSRRQLQLNGCLRICPLSNDYVVDILSESAGSNSGLLKVVRKNRKLADLLQTPLFLILALEAYYGLPEGKISKSAPSWSASIIAAYLAHAQERLMSPIKVDMGGRTWLTELAIRSRRNLETVFYPDRMPIDYVSANNLHDVAARRSGLLGMIFTATVITLVRVPFLAAIFSSNLFKAYALTSLGFVVGVAAIARSYGRQAIRHPLAGTRSRNRWIWLNLIRNWVIGYMCLGSMASLADHVAALGFLVFVGGIIVGLYPGTVLLKSSVPDTERVPRYPGEENRSLFLTCITCAALAAGTFYVSLFLVLEPISLGDHGFLPLPAPELMLYFAVPYAMLVGLRNGGIDLIARYAALKIATSSKLLPNPYFRSFDALRAASIIVPRQGGYQFIHALLLVP